MNMIDEFRAAFLKAGIMPPEEILPDGELHRFHIEGDKRGSMNGWYILHLDKKAAGTFGSWKTNLRSTWFANRDHTSRDEREAFTRALNAAKAKAEADRRAEQEALAIGARSEWANARPAKPAHPYLVAKAVKAHGLRQMGGMLLVPLFDDSGLLWNVQRIAPNGEKRFRRGRATGLFSPLGDLTEPTTLLICEGWATGATLYEESGRSVLCAMNAGNLLPVARLTREKWINADLIVCADNDRFTIGNPGVTAAKQAAKQVGARLSIPHFPEGVPGSDFNDLAALRREGRA